MLVVGVDGFEILTVNLKIFWRVRAKGESITVMMFLFLSIVQL
jgi:hypothetical protein